MSDNKPKKPASETMRAAWISVAAVLLAAIIAGIFSLFSGNASQGDCSPVITGTVSGNIEQACERDKK